MTTPEKNLTSVNKIRLSGPFNTDEIPKYGKLDLSKTMPIMDPFREAALFYKKNGTYPHFNPKQLNSIDRRPSSKFTKFWREEHKRCLNGMTYKGEHISGSNYAHLNYGRMWKYEFTDEESKKIARGEKVPKSRIYGFPDPWDSTYHIFNYAQEARIRGEHVALYKSRGIGASYILSTEANNVYHHVKGSKTFFIAPAESYLVDTDGSLYRTFEHMDFLTNNTPFFKIRSGTKSNTALTRKSKADSKKAGKSTGRSGASVSAIQGVVVINPNKFRGPRGERLIFDEAGINKKITDTISISKRAFEQQGLIGGQMWAVGTGGASINDMAGFSHLMRNPGNFSFMPILDIFSKTIRPEQPTALFMGAYWNRPGFMDKHGRSKTVDAYDAEIETRKKLAKLTGKDAKEYKQHISENAIHPEEALQNVATSNMPVELLHAQEDNLISNKIALEVGRMDIKDPNKGIFIPDDTLVPLIKFPTAKGQLYKGAVCIKERPKNEFNYIAGVDPYAQDKSTTTSHGAIYIWCIETDRLVANYVGRPNKTTQFLKTCIALARMYNNAETLVENDIPEFNSVYKYEKAYSLLARAPKIFKTLVPNSKTIKLRKRGAPKNNKVYNNTLNWVRDWLLGASENSIENSNIETLWDIGLIKELLLSAENLNFDRLNAFSQLFLLRQEKITDRKMSAVIENADPIAEELLNYLKNLT